MFERRHYKELASVLNQAYRESTPDEWSIIYDKVYTPLVKRLEQDNERFDMTKFAYVVGDLR